MTKRLPRPIANELSVRWATRMIDVIEQNNRQLELPFGLEYQVTNLTKTRTFDASSATLDDLRQVVGTLIQDLIDAGKLGDTTS